MSEPHGRPSFLVVGAARAGTTALVEGLRGHPEVFVTEPKEPHYFGLHGRPADFGGPGDADHINRSAVTSESAYLALYPPEATYQALGDGSVSTMYYHAHAIPEILRVNPQMRIVMLLREPVARAYSAYQFQRVRGLEPCEDFMAAVAEESNRQTDNWHHLWHYTSMSRYAEAVQAFQDAFPPGHVGIWFYDDLDRDHDRVVTQILDFVGVRGEAGATPSSTERAARVNVGGTPRYPRVQRSIWWATRQPALRSVVRSVTSYRLREAVRARIIARQEVPDDVRRELGPLFEEDLRRLRLLLDGPVPTWLSDPRV